MLNNILWVLLIIALIYSIYAIIQSRKKTGMTGLKSLLTLICFYLIAVTNLLAYWLGFLGIFSWSITVVFLILGIYFTKYLPNYKR